MSDPASQFDPLILSNILTFTTPKVVVRLGAVSKRWLAMTSQEVLWKELCERDFRVTTKSAPGELSGSMQDLSHFKAAWVRWHSWGESLGLQAVDGPLYGRVRDMWAKIEDWTAAHKPTIRASLSHGATDDDFSALEAELGIRLPDVYRLIWSVHDGQSLQFDDEYDATEEFPHRLSHQIFDGLLGGYSFYDHLACTRLYPVRRTLAQTQARADVARSRGCFRDALRPSQDISRIIIAASFNYRKPFLLDVDDGMVLVLGTEHRGRDGLHTPACAPHGPLGLLRWMEEFASRLATGIYTLGALVPAGPGPENPVCRGVSLFPQTGPLSSTCITQGIEATASAIFCPEAENSMFTYSLRLRVCAPADFPYATAQLQSRHWRITDGTGHTEEVQGPGVVGKHPVLRPGGYRDDSVEGEGEDREGVFVYQSVSGRLAKVPPGAGVFRGSLQFVPGTIDDPTGELFEVVVAPFPLAVPDFIF